MKRRIEKGTVQAVTEVEQAPIDWVLDEDLFEAMRHQITWARNRDRRYDPKKLKVIMGELNRRGLL